MIHPNRRPSTRRNVHHATGAPRRPDPLGEPRPHPAGPSAAPPGRNPLGVLERVAERIGAVPERVGGRVVAVTTGRCPQRPGCATWPLVCGLPYPAVCRSDRRRGMIRSGVLRPQKGRRRHRQFVNGGDLGRLAGPSGMQQSLPYSASGSSASIARRRRRDTASSSRRSASSPRAARASAATTSGSGVRPVPDANESMQRSRRTSVLPGEGSAIRRLSATRGSR